jgi:SAM-dependent methyltransferase
VEVSLAHYETGYHSTHQKPLYTRDDYYLARAEGALEYFTAAEREGRVFDYGCGLGASIYLLPNAEGWDVSGEARARCRERGVRVYDRLRDVPTGAYDTVLCRHVLEHVEEPLAVLRSMRALLKPTGTLVLVLPKERFWLPRSTRPDMNQHLYCWTPRTIYNLLWRAGFVPGLATFQYPFGALRLMPVRRKLGARTYRRAVRVGRILRRNGEMVIRARMTEAAGR